MRLADGATLSRLSLTDDGRILVPYVNSAGEVAQVILDPRDPIIYGTEGRRGPDEPDRRHRAVRQGGNDTLLGHDANDTLDGGSGVDVLRAGKGNDRYVLDDGHGPDGPSVKQYDAVIENPGGGTDTVLVRGLNVDPFSQFDAYALPAYVENAVVTGALAFGLYGNELGNVLTGNAAANGIGGLAGNDRLNGGGGGDSLFGHAGDDTYILADLFSPSAGVFSYDAVSEAVGEGIDTVRVLSLDINRSGADGYTLGANIERGVVDGSAAFNLTGNELANTLTGNAAANVLFGGGGNDVLIGGGGADGLNGGAGADRFRFLAAADSTTAARDRIVGFSQAQRDRIDLAAIDANGNAGGDRAFTLLNGGSFTGAPGQLIAVVSGADTVVLGDVNGDELADLAIRVVGIQGLDLRDFIL
jgi:Ca2+-binding RTX toxin-like protein